MGRPISALCSSRCVSWQGAWLSASSSSTVKGRASEPLLACGATPSACLPCALVRGRGSPWFSSPSSSSRLGRASSLWHQRDALPSLASQGQLLAKGSRVRCQLCDLLLNLLCGETERRALRGSSRRPWNSVLCKAGDTCPPGCPPRRPCPGGSDYLSDASTGNLGGACKQNGKVSGSKLYTSPVATSSHLR